MLRNLEIEKYIFFLFFFVNRSISAINLNFLCIIPYLFFRELCLRLLIYAQGFVSENV